MSLCKKVINLKWLFLLCLVCNTLIILLIPYRGVWRNAPEKRTTFSRLTRRLEWISKTKVSQVSPTGASESELSEMACKLPQLDPFAKSIRHLTSVEVKPANCEKLYPQVFHQITTNNTNAIIRLNGTYEWTDCWYKVVGKNVTITRRVAPPTFISESKETYDLKNYSKTFIPPDHEFIAVSCKVPLAFQRNLPAEYKKRVDRSRLIVDTFAFTPLKPHVEERVSVLQRNHPAINPEEQVNVVLLGLDSMSHMHLKRRLPRLLEYITKDLGAIGMNGYVRVGDSTWANTAALTGNLTREEMHSGCYYNGYSDTCPFIWKDYATFGYRTSIVEDWNAGEVFPLKWSITEHPPADYHLQPLMAFAHNHTGGDKIGWCPICLGPRLALDIVLQYMKSLATSMGTTKRYFQFAWSNSISHESFNTISLAEPSLLETLKWFNSEGHLNNTIFILASDHGAKQSTDLLYHSQGKIEGNMPFLYFILPDWFKAKYPRAHRNLMTNRNRFTTHFDTYATLKDILHLASRIGDEELKRREVKLNEGEGTRMRGISLFLPIPPGRTCESAQIPLPFCVCRNKVPVDASSSNVTEAAAAAVRDVNQITQNEPDCEVLNLQDVISATRDASAFSEFEQYKPQDQVIEVEFSTSPGNATFSAVMTRNHSSSLWISSGPISRTNLYGTQSHCVSNAFHKPYCFCKHQQTPTKQIL